MKKESDIMKKILLATHGNFASGIKSSLEIILGEQETVHAIDAYVGERSFEDQLKAYLKTINEQKDIVIIMTDLFGGSVNQKAMNLVQSDHIHIVTGLNLPLLLELQLLTEEQCTKEKIKQLINTSREQVMYVDRVDTEEDGDDFDL